MITEEEISHQNNNFFDLSHPTVQVDLVWVTCTTVASGAAQYSTDMLLDSRPANTLVTVNMFWDIRPQPISSI